MFVLFDCFVCLLFVYCMVGWLVCFVLGGILVVRYSCTEPSPPPCIALQLHSATLPSTGQRWTAAEIPQPRRRRRSGDGGGGSASLPRGDGCLGRNRLPAVVHMCPPLPPPRHSHCCGGEKDLSCGIVCASSSKHWHAYCWT